MGAWGEYDDENDTVADAWLDIEEAAMGKSKIKAIVGDDYETLNNLKREYLMNHPDKLYGAIKAWLTNHKKVIQDLERKRESKAKKSTRTKNNKEEMDNLRWEISTIVGIALKAARVMSDSPSSDPLGAGIFNSGIPKKIPEGSPRKLPEWLRNEALEALEIVIQMEKANDPGWRSPKAREKALQNELSFFL